VRRQAREREPTQELCDAPSPGQRRGGAEGEAGGDHDRHLVHREHLDGAGGDDHAQCVATRRPTEAVHGEPVGAFPVGGRGCRCADRRQEQHHGHRRRHHDTELPSASLHQPCGERVEHRGREGGVEGEPGDGVGLPSREEAGGAGLGDVIEPACTHEPRAHCVEHAEGEWGGGESGRAQYQRAESATQEDRGRPPSVEGAPGDHASHTRQQLRHPEGADQGALPGPQVGDQVVQQHAECVDPRAVGGHRHARQQHDDRLAGGSDRGVGFHGPRVKSISSGPNPPADPLDGNNRRSWETSCRSRPPTAVDSIELAFETDRCRCVRSAGAAAG
jgi:hypothetical protein